MPGAAFLVVSQDEAHNVWLSHFSDVESDW